VALFYWNGNGWVWKADLDYGEVEYVDVSSCWGEDYLILLLEGSAYYPPSYELHVDVADITTVP